MMGIQVQSILTAYIVNFGVTFVQPQNQIVDQVITSQVNDESKIRENFQNLFDSIAKNNTKKSDIHHEVLKQEIAREQQVFDAMKEELWIAQNRNVYKKRNFHKNNTVNENVVVSKREANEHDQSPDLEKFKKLLDRARSVVVITGSGISVESGIPLLRGANAYYKNREVRLLRTPTSFKKNPTHVWEFIDYQRETILTKKPNKAHYALVDFEKRCRREGRNFTLITQNTDGLHRMAGSQNLIELYGSMLRTKCTVCGDIERNLKSPICPAFGKRGHKPNMTRFSRVPITELPRCEKEDCNGLLRPDIVFFGEGLDPRLEEKTDASLEKCDLCLIIGTSAQFYPVTGFMDDLVWKRIPVAEFNTETTPQTSLFQFHFRGPCTKTIPEALA